MNESSENNPALTTDISNYDQSSSNDPLTCCHHQSDSTDDQQLSSNDKSKALQRIYNKSQNKHDWTCAQFYEERIRSLLEIFSEVLSHFSFSFFPTASHLEKCIRIHDNQLANWSNSQFLWSFHPSFMLSTISQISYGQNIPFTNLSKRSFFLEKNLF